MQQNAKILIFIVVVVGFLSFYLQNSITSNTIDNSYSEETDKEVIVAGDELMSNETVSFNISVGVNDNISTIINHDNLSLTLESLANIHDNSNNNSENGTQIDDTDIETATSGKRNQLIWQHTYSNPWIIENGCVMTVSLLDPSLGPPVFFTLESVAENVHPINQTCILIQTSICRIQKNYNLEEDLSSYNEAYMILTELIYNSSKPLLRSLIELGNVRVSIFNHTKYQTSNCQDFRSVNNPFFHIDYWSDYYYFDTQGNKIVLNSNNNSNTDIISAIGTDDQVSNSKTNLSFLLSGEFVPNQDSDFILVIQNDAVLCHGLDVFSWNHFPFVGAPWGTGYVCRKFRKQWYQWHAAAYGYNESTSTIPYYPNDMCTNPEVAPYGNGGLSLRSRYWMREAIRYCPQVSYSGLSEQEKQNAPCLHTGIRFDSQEDVYYGVILRGMFSNMKNVTSHRMPTVLEASLFATESRYFMDHYNAFSSSSQYSEEVMVKQLWWRGENGTLDNDTDNSTLSYHEGWDRYQRMKTIWIESNHSKPIVPIGYHAIHKYDASLIKWAYHHIIEECPYLIGILPARFILPPLPTGNNTESDN
jgi:Protein of unknown function (DUF5672)